MYIKHSLSIFLSVSLVVFYNSSFSQDLSDADEEIDKLLHILEPSPIEVIPNEPINVSPEAKQRDESIPTPGDVATEVIIAGMVVKNMTTEQVILSIGAPMKKVTISPDVELWKYPEGEIAFAGGKVSYAGFTERKNFTDPRQWKHPEGRIDASKGTVSNQDPDKNHHLNNKFALLIASLGTTSEAIDFLASTSIKIHEASFDERPEIFLTENGRYTIGIIMEEKPDCLIIKDRMLNKNLIPGDSYCATTRRLVKRLSDLDN